MVTNMEKNFTHLHVHSEFSLLDGFCRINALVKAAAEKGMDSVALTDHGVLFGAIDFYKACQKEKIHPVIGCEVYVSPRGLEQKEPQLDKERFHLILLAENNKGYKNLMRIVSKGFIDGFYYKPRIDHNYLKENSEGLICLSACIGGEIPQMILNNDVDGAVQRCLLYQNIFGKDHFFLEIQDHRLREEALVNERMLEFSKKYEIPLVATNDVHYINKEDSENHDVLLCIQTAATVQEEKRMRFPNNEFYLKSPEEMSKLFLDVPEAIENSNRIAKRCQVTFDLEETHLPKFELPANENAKDYLKKLCIQGMQKKYQNASSELDDRLEYELDTIHTMGFDDYFLIVWDFIKYAKDHQIMVGPGRGSAAGSVVAYCLGITTIDPIKYQLLFERFLNPERVTMPDIDVDFCYERRQEVIDYVVHKYGEDRVAQIITFGTMAARGALRDVGRALDMPYNAVDRVAKEIPIHPGANVTIKDALEENPELRKMEAADEDVAKLIRTAQSIEGLSRHASTHAAGVVISDKPLVEYIPLYRNNDAITTQFPMGLLEDLGLLKMDFLGLRTLTVIRDALENIVLSGRPCPDLEALEMNDAKVYEMLSKGDTMGVFQLESRGMQQFMKELQPSNFEDIIAGISLYRPGPMEQIPRYIENKKNPNCISYDHPILEPILNVTYGCMVYQEQVMQIFRDVAGFSMGRSDLVRRAMSKKKGDVMEAEGQVFIHGEVNENGKIVVDGAIRRGVPEKVAIKIFVEMKDFAKYAFNKSHAAAYAVISYQTAWLKYFHPTAFMAALMSSIMDDEKKVAKYIEDCRKIGIQVLPPNINASYEKFSVSENSICFGLGAVKGLGKNAIAAIIEARKKSGDFQSLREFCERVDLKSLNKRSIESLIKGGAFDSIGNNRAQMLATAELIVDQVQREKKDRLSGQMSLLDMANLGDSRAMLILKEEHFPQKEPFSKEERLVLEKEVLGLYVTGHPLEKYEEILKKTVTLFSNMIDSYQDLKDAGIRDGQQVSVGGLIAELKTMMTKKGQMMCFLTIEDLYGRIEVVVFPRTYDEYRNYLKQDQPIVIKGRINYNEEAQTSVIASQICPIGQPSNQLKTLKVEEISAPYETTNGTQLQKKLVLSFDDLTEKSLIKTVKSVLIKYPGPVPVVLYLRNDHKNFGANRNLWVTPGEALISELTHILGNQNVEVK
ncbi:DNA polymerase III subunit alpha [Acetobacterium paludosum]|uniref:DNA polymerase III subunit alpha n=2 Tax=Acetobacterium paludosum TaxID=52693 RepID=A0A923KWQ9_9FIRM|nr:DNA polymerase III subunit alpha [Acetobacterium paludosum]